MFKTVIEEAQTVNTVGKVISMEHIKTKYFFGIPLYKYIFIKEIDDSAFEKPKEQLLPYEGKIIGFGTNRIELDDNYQSDTLGI